MELVEVEVAMMVTTVVRWPFCVDVQKLVRDVFCLLPESQTSCILIESGV